MVAAHHNGGVFSKFIQSAFGLARTAFLGVESEFAPERIERLAIVGLRL
jgi:hypothetical protein